MNSTPDHRIAIFASGNGSNAENIIQYFNNNNKTARVVAIFSDQPDAFVLERAKKLNVPSFIITMKEFKESNVVLNKLHNLKIDFIVLAGFLRLVPQNIINAFPNRILNIHPALLPKYGGKGMHGRHVHESVLAAKEKETGITIHYVNEKYDEGETVFNAKVAIDETDSIETIAQKVHELEFRFFPEVIEKVLASL